MNVNCQAETSKLRREPKSFDLFCRQCLLVTALSGFTTGAWAGAYIFAGEGNGVDLITHPEGYSGAGGVIQVDVCIDPASPNLGAMTQSVQNIIDVWNQQLPTSGNVRFGVISGSQVDFESVALHELGHCIGEAHVNAASESGLTGANRNYTKATDGANNAWNINPGADSVIDSRDDIRPDDINLHWYRTANNNPFTLDYQTIDSTTYARNTASLPSGHAFATNGDRTLAASVMGTPDTEAVMQQLTFFGEIQRSLTHDGVATLQYAMSGVDELDSTADDYTILLNYIPTTTGCEVKLDFDNTQTGFAVCQTSGVFIASGHASITSANIYFNTGFNWLFNSANPCSENLALTQNQWALMTLPCSVADSSNSTVADILGDDLTGTYGNNWVVYEHDAVANQYRLMETTDVMSAATGYWVASNQVGQTIDVEGQYNGSPDIPLSGAAGGRVNLIGHPFDYSVDWENVQVVDGADVKSLSAAVAAGDISETYHFWNGNSHQARDASTPGLIGTLNSFDGIWVKAFKDGIYLRVPTGAYVAPAGEEPGPGRTPEPPGGAGDHSWFVRLVVESDQFIDDGNVLGQLPDSVNGLDSHDLEEPAPFGDAYLTIIFPHDEWGTGAWGYTSDFHASTAKPSGEWLFAVVSSGNISTVNLRLEGPAEILKVAELRDVETGQRVKINDEGYSFDAFSGVRHFTFSIPQR
jgi:hypothetical protein